MRNEKSGVLENLVRMLKRKQEIDEWEIFYSSQDGISIEAKDGTVESMKVSCSKGIGVRVLKDKRLGFSFSSDLSDNALSNMIDNALSAGSAVTADEFYSFPLAEDIKSKELGLFDKTIKDTPEAKKIEKSLLLEDAARSFDKRVRQVRNAVYSETTYSSSILNSKGINLTDNKTFASGSIMAVAEENNDSQMGWEMDFSHFVNDIDAQKIGIGAAKRAVSMLGAREIKSIKCPVVLENSVAVEFLEVIAPSFLADNIHKGKSMLKDKKGKKIFSDCITILDNGIMHRGWSSSLFDSEGIPKQKTSLITNGVLENYLYDTYWAKREGVESTGNSSRSGFKSVPGISISNMYIKNGDTELDSLMKEANKGVFITGLLGVHTVNTISGDFSIGAAGFYIENGTVSCPVRGMAIAGNLLDLFSRIIKTGNDIRFFGNIGAPSLLLHKMDISGAG
ncbi:MAG: hypothetical protein A2073_08370 [Deltaproteobacteria bacterium GWC2_42_11]|nr:MAG: hypothetical protein A2073_08370 [Deltaproteobacteria bacterium GWC2_42_11]